MEIYLNMTNPIYVSSSDEVDRVDVKVIEPFFFQSKRTNITTKMNFTTIAWLPPMVDKDEATELMNIVDSSKNSILITLIIPFAFMVFMSVSMNRVWSLYLML